MSELEILLGMTEKQRDIYFLRMAFQVAKNFSQDENTQTGAIIVDSNFNITSFGSNRANYGDPRRYEGRGNKIIFERPDKYSVLLHAERDAHFVANRLGKSVVGCTLYTTWNPCKECSEVTVNNGIKRYVTHDACTKWYFEANKNVKNRLNWEDSIKKALDIFKRSIVDYICLSEPIGGVEILFDDKLRKP